MAKDDVVKHDLTSSMHFDSNEAVEPVEGFDDRQAPGAAALEAKPSSDRKVTSEELKQSPYCSVGLMRLKFDLDKPAKGASGWVVAPKAFITAGHCVYHYNFGGWIKQAAFCPRFAAGCPKAFTVSTVYTLQGWIDRDWGYDLAACVVTEAFTEAEPPLAWEPFTLPPGLYVALGYPIKPTSKHDFNGERMWRAQGELRSYSGGIITAANDFTGGSSGGPWLAPPDGKVGAITSRRTNPQSTDIAESPPFLAGFQKLYDTVKGL